MNKNIEFYNYKTNTIVTKDGIIMYPLCKILNQINERNNVNLNSHKILKNPETIAFLQTFTDNTINIDKLFIPNVIEYSKNDSTYYISGQILQFILLHYDTSFAKCATNFLETLRNIYNNMFNNIIEKNDLDLLQYMLDLVAPETIIENGVEKIIYKRVKKNSIV